MVMESPVPTYSDDSARSLIRAASITHLLSSKAQWDKTKPKGRCQCYACDERDGQGQNCSYVNCSYVHGNHPLQRCLEQESGENLCPTSQWRLRVKWNYSRPTSGLEITDTHS